MATLGSDNPAERIGAVITAREKKLPLVDEFISLLEDDFDRVRQEARFALVDLAEGADFGPQPEAGKDNIQESVEQWSKWNSCRRYRQQYASLSDEKLTALLEDSDPVKRWAAVSEVRGRRLPLYGELIGLVRDQDSDVRQATRQALIDLAGGEYDFGPLKNDSDSVNDEAFARWTKWWQREQIIANDQRLDLESLVGHLSAPSPARRWAALTLICRRGVNLPARFLAIVRDADNEVRQEARRALVQMADGEDYGPSDGAPESEVANAADDWDQWWVRRKAEIESIAQNRLRMAKIILEVNKQKGRARLERIVKEFATTPAGREAKRMLVEDPSPAKEPTRADDVDATSSEPGSQTASKPGDGDRPPAAAGEGTRASSEHEEKLAQKSFEFARKFASRHPEIAQGLLEDLIRKYPDTKAAAAAKEVLSKITPVVSSPEAEAGSP